MTLKTQLTYWVECYKDVAERNALAETPKESAEYLLSLILSEIDKAALTEEQFDELPDDLISVYDEPIDQKEGILRTKKMIAAAQLKAIKNRIGEGK